MNNKYLERELIQNISNHELFECQTCNDLDNIKPFLEKNYLLTEIIVELDYQKIEDSILLNIFPYESLENKLIWKQFIAVQIMKELRKKLYLKRSKELEEQETLIYKKTKEDYFNYKKTIPTDENIKELISIVNTPIRIHFIIKYYDDKYMCDAISDYLDNNLCFNTMVYSNRYLKQLENNRINCIRFNKLEEGKYLDNSKQKVKKYEEV